MKRTLFILAALLLFTGCEVEDLTMKTRNAVRLTVNTYYETGPKTRTVYSGSFYGETPQYERIDWLSTDLLRVWAQLGDAGAQGDYKIKAGTISPDGKNSTAEAEAVTALNWIDYGTHTFYALYPSPATTTVDGDKVKLNKDVITATIPATQVVTAATDTKVYKPNMDYAYMWAATTADYNTAVSLDFKPLMTAFEFTVKSAGSSFNLASFVLSTDDSYPVIAGDFTAKVSTDLGSCPVTTVTNGSRSITVSLGNVQVSATDPVTFTIFALPQQLTHLTMQFNIQGGTTKKVALMQRASESEPYDFVTFEPGKKYRITNVGVPNEDGWVYTLEEVVVGADMERDDPTAGTATKGMKSYKTKDGSSTPVAMSFRYSPADEHGDCANNWSNSGPAWLESLVQGEPSGTTYTLEGTYTAMDLVSTERLNEIKDHIDILKATGRNNNRGESNPQDLALYDIDNLTGSARSAKTANCYVVDRAGWYMFPLVYGNAIDWGKASSNGWNVGAYYDGTGNNNWDTGYTILHRFRNYLNRGITTPYILDDIGKSTSDVEAVIVWEDVESSKPFIKASTVSVVELASSNYADQAGTTLTTVPFIRFQVDPTNIRQGNAVIALREKTGDKRIIWSWHIWVTDTDLSTITVATRSTTNPIVESNEMLKVDLGWCDTKVITDYTYTPRKYFVEVTQVEGNAAPVVFAVTQTGPPSVTVFIGAGTFYQYGRKDPFLPMKGTWAYPFNKDSHSPAGYTVTVGSGTIPNIAVGNTSCDGNVSGGIQNPHTQYNCGPYNGWVSAMPYNLWDVTETRGHDNGANPTSYPDKKVCKSIYDPCPPGFSVPHFKAFTIFTNSGGNVSPAASWAYWNNTNPWVGGDPRTTDPIETVGLEGGPGVVFYTSVGEGAGTIYFPFHGYRHDGIVDPTFFFLLNSKHSGYLYSVTFTAGGTMGGSHTKSNAYHIRAMKEHLPPYTETVQP